jgi:hypothetical protein
MKIAFALLASALLATTAVSAAGAESQSKPAVAAPAPASADRSVEAALAKLFSDHKATPRTTSCEEVVYEWCMSYCYDLSMNYGCSFYASQECLCQRASADCPACY